MSFFNVLKNVAGEFLTAAGSHNTQDAATPHAFADNLLQHVDSMDQSTLLNLGQQLLQTFSNHPAYPSDGSQAAQEAGTTAEAVASGDSNAISTLIAFAKNHPEILQTVARSFNRGTQE